MMKAHITKNQVLILKECIKNILNRSCNWEGPNGLDFAAINEQASICWGVLNGEYKVGHPYAPIPIDKFCGKPKGTFKKFVKKNPVL